MKKVFQILLVAGLSCGISIQAMSQTKTASKSKPKQEQSANVLRHVVLFKFKDSSTPEQVKTVQQAFSALPGKINTIIDYEWGTNVSPENLAQGYTHAFMVTFKDAAGRDFYLPHPAHKAFVDVLGPHLDKVLVIDFVANKK
jgi:Stress responsive A/B Barrel Domain